MVVDGEVEVVRDDRWIRLGPGTVVGEMGLLDPQPRSATIVALTPVQALRLRRRYSTRPCGSAPRSRAV